MDNEAPILIVTFLIGVVCGLMLDDVLKRAVDGIQRRRRGR